jgi:hypothetical protein
VTAGRFGGIAARVTTDTGEFADTEPSTSAYTIPNVPIGTYAVSASATGYDDSIPQNVTVEDGASATAIFILQATAVDPPVDPPPPTDLNASVVQRSHGGEDGKRHLDIVVATASTTATTMSRVCLSQFRWSWTAPPTGLRPVRPVATA